MTKFIKGVLKLMDEDDKKFTMIGAINTSAN